jgi:leucyl/phenylalanyl-tRNA--protein transferase
MPDPGTVPAGQEAVAIGADLAPATLLAGYRRGLFPMPYDHRLAWLSPDPRGVLPVDGLHVARSLRRSARGVEVSVDQAFAEVLQMCADPARPGAWITADYAQAYRGLHDLGWAHSIEVWRERRLIGGLLGVEIGGLFCGESMARRATDGSKLALWATVSLLSGPDAAERVFDVQWLTPHLASLGAVEVSRADYLAALPTALARPARLEPLTLTPADQVLPGGTVTAAPPPQ